MSSAVADIANTANPVITVVDNVNEVKAEVNKVETEVSKVDESKADNDGMPELEHPVGATTGSSVASTPGSSVEETSNSTPAREQTPQEILLTLERAYIDRVRVLTELKDNLLKMQDQVLAAQDGAFKAYQNLSIAKEQYLITVVSSQKNYISQMAAVKNDTPSEPVVSDLNPPAAPSREDNL
jgi:hypothetical protein